MQVCPEVFEVKDDDCLYLSTETPTEDLRAKVEDSIRRCPRQAIVLEEV
jgi:ferredoxin